MLRHGAKPPGTPGEVFRAFLALGLRSFGGPVAHLGYFRDELVTRRRWIDEAGYGELVALCQFLPGPSSSQVGFALGMLRAGGLAGGLAAWCGFTLPSALAMFAFARGAGRFGGASAAGLLHGLKLVAVAVVAQAVWGMARTLAPDRTRAAIAFAALAAVLLAATTWGTVFAIALGAAAGTVLCREGPAIDVERRVRMPVTRRQGGAALGLFAALLVLPPLAAGGGGGYGALATFDGFYRSGALVFGGGHVVLPLLQAEVGHPAGVADPVFLAGYGAAQAVPGPLFSIAAYLGAVVPDPGHDGGFVAAPAASAAIALVAIFLPGLLLVYGALPFWDGLRVRPTARAAMRGANAAVVGILGAAFYSPVWTATVAGPRDVVLAVAGLLLLTVFKAPSWIVVVLLAGTGALLGAMVGV